MIFFSFKKELKTSFYWRRFEFEQCLTDVVPLEVLSLYSDVLVIVDVLPLQDSTLGLASAV